MHTSNVCLSPVTERLLRASRRVDKSECRQLPVEKSHAQELYRINVIWHRQCATLDPAGTAMEHDSYIYIYIYIYRERERERERQGVKITHRCQSPLCHLPKIHGVFDRERDFVKGGFALTFPRSGGSPSSFICDAPPLPQQLGVKPLFNSAAGILEFLHGPEDVVRGRVAGHGVSDIGGARTRLWTESSAKVRLSFRQICPDICASRPV